MHHERPSEAHALAHAAGQLAGIGRLESVQTDEVDRGQGAFADLRPRHSLRLQTQSNVFEHGQPGKQRETLEHHGNPRRRTHDRLAEVLKAAGAGFGQTGDQTQQRRFPDPDLPSNPTIWPSRSSRFMPSSTSNSAPSGFGNALRTSVHCSSGEFSTKPNLDQVSRYLRSA